jgi:hypothetical protein|tara:strand:+ start:2616 stop:3182 length:567 start_codon:yes stop_codon:yes gene_type:complete
MMPARMPPKKKRKTTPSNHWSMLASISKSNATLSQQKEQYYALLQQVCTIVEKEWTGPEQSTIITKHVTDWINTVLQQQQSVLDLRNEALHSMRKTDVLEDDALKEAAAVLTEREFQLSAHKNVIDRFSRIVRYKEGSLPQHTAHWLKRFFTQWKKTNKVFDQNILTLRESFEWLAVSFPQMLEKGKR